MRFLQLFICVLVVACSSEPEDDGGYITSAGGEEEVDSTDFENEVEYDMLNQPLIITYFYKLSLEQITDEYCYDEAQVKNLLMGDGPDEYTWVKKIVKDNYLRFDNDECYTTTEFAILNPESNEPHAVLNQSSKGSQQLNFYSWNEGGGTWEEVTAYPKLKMTDFYHELSAEDAKLVNQFGAYFGSVNENNQHISYSFSTWQMGLNADGKEIMNFNEEPDYSFELIYDNEDGFWMKKIYEDIGWQPRRYFLAYSETGETSEDFSYFSDAIAEQLKDDNVEFAFADFTQTNYKGIFAEDTFDFSSMQQFEPRNGYWFFERGKEPLDLDYDMVEPTLKKAKRYFYEK